MTPPVALTQGLIPQETIRLDRLAVRADGGLVIRGLWRFYLHAAFL